MSEALMDGINDALHDGRTKVLQKGVTDRQTELHRLAGILANASQKQARLGIYGKVVTIVLGAVAATNGAAASITGDHKVYVIIFYTLVGLVIAAIAALEAAFKTEQHATELRMLAAVCQSTIWQIDTTWQKTVGVAPTIEAKIRGYQALLDVQDHTLRETQTRAVQLGVNITLEVRAFYSPDPDDYPAAA